ncbi:hypothetical protein ACYCMD_25160, partial [Klebsiella pneumoniae]
PQNDVTLKMPAFEWVHVQLHQQKGMISLSPPTICNSAYCSAVTCFSPVNHHRRAGHTVPRASGANGKQDMLQK